MARDGFTDVQQQLEVANYGGGKREPGSLNLVFVVFAITSLRRASHAFTR